MCLAPIANHEDSSFEKNVFISANRSGCLLHVDNMRKFFSRPWPPSFSLGENELAKCGHSPQVLFLRSQLKIAYGKLIRDKVGGLGRLSHLYHMSEV